MDSGGTVAAAVAAGVEARGDAAATAAILGIDGVERDSAASELIRGDALSGPSFV